MRALILFFLLLSISCQDSPPLISKLRSCCETDPILVTVGNGSVYVPNIFTPDNNGINDALTVFATPEISQIKKFEIWKGSKLIFSASDMTPNSGANTWDGRDDGDLIKGLFSIEMEVVDNAGTSQIITGEVCSVPCGLNDDKDKKFSNIDNCFFGTQHNGIGGVDINLPTFETLGCLE